MQPQLKIKASKIFSVRISNKFQPLIALFGIAAKITNYVKIILKITQNISQVITLYTLYIYYFIGQLHLNKAGKII